MENDIQREAISAWVKKGDLEKVTAVGIHGVPELKHDEKIRFLGEFKERVIKLLTKKQVIEPAIYPEIVHALGDNRAEKLIISGDIGDRFTQKYQQLSKNLGKSYTIIHDPEFKGDAGLIVASGDAVDAADINVLSRAEKLKKLGVPAAIIDAAGKKICSKCMDGILSIAPCEGINYHELTLADRFWGEHCAACVVH